MFQNTYVSITSIPPDFAFAINDGHICKFDFPLLFADEEIPPKAKSYRNWKFYAISEHLGLNKNKSEIRVLCLANSISSKRPSRDKDDFILILSL